MLKLKTTLVGLALTAPLYAPTIADADARSSWSHLKHVARLFGLH
jgi:hypothetical protein